MTEYDDPIVGRILRAVPFSVDVECEAYPDVVFHIVFSKRPDKTMTEQVENALGDYMEAYSRWHFFRPIHYISEADNSLSQYASVFSVCIHMDFGNANPKALVGAVKAIADTGLPIYHLTLE